MSKHKHKKSLGQHFLRDDSIAESIVEAVVVEKGKRQVIEVGPGEGVLTQFLLNKEEIDLHLVELDRRLIPVLQNRFPLIQNQIIEQDFLKLDLTPFSQKPLSIVGNFPYNISSQIVFKVIENREFVWQMVGMFQKEVAQRITASPGNKSYGILSVLTQLFFETNYLFDVPAHCFNPPPKVISGVMSMKRSNKYEIDEKEYPLFKRMVKQAFSQRRKKLNNALKGIEFQMENIPPEIWDKRAEQLSVDDYLNLTRNCHN